MLSKKLEKAINEQVTKEIFSAHLYLSMAAYLDSVDLPGASNWMKLQYKEELMHAEKLMNFVMERDGRAIISKIDAPKAEWNSVLDVFEEAYAHEQKVTAWIGELVKIAREEADYATEIFLQWFITEQIEEEGNTKAIVQQFKMIDNSRHGLFMLDKELGSRTLNLNVNEQM